MAPIKFEEKIREKLEERAIKPSENAWERLSDRLDSNNGKKESNIFWWVGIAASIIGVLFFVTHFWNDDLKDAGIPNLVEEPVIIKEEEPKLEVPFKVVNSKNKEEDILEVKDNFKKNTQLVLDKVVDVNEVSIAGVDLSKQIEKENVLEPKKKDVEKLSFEDKKIQEVVAQINTLHESNEVVTDKTIEALLERAQQEIMEERVQKRYAGIVDAASLLESVEYELDESFRDKVFKALKDNLGKVKTAVAQRND